MGHKYSSKNLHVWISPALERVGDVVLKHVVQIGNPLRIHFVQAAPIVIRGRAAYSVDAAQDGNPVRSPDVGWCAHAEFSAEHV